MQVNPNLQLSTLIGLCGEVSALTLERPSRSVQGYAGQVATLLQSKLSALSVTIDLDVGFKNCQVSSLRADHKAVFDSQPESVKELKLSTSHRDAGDFSLGHLKLVFDGSNPLASENDGFKTIASLVSTGILVSARDHFNDVLNALSVHLNTTRFPNPESFCKDIEEALQDEGIRSLVVEISNSSSFIGSDENIEIIKNLSFDESRDECRIVSNPAGDESGAIIEIYLPTSRARIWLLPDRKGFKQELHYPSPWREFLDRLALLMDFTLSKISVAESENLDQSTVVPLGVFAATVTMGLFIHQIKNLSHDIHMLAVMLEEESHLGQTKDPNRQASLLESNIQHTRQLGELLNNLSNSTWDERKPFPLLDAINRSKRLFENSLTDRQIQLEIDISPDCSVDVPFNVAVFAFANLISNARDAIWADGLIRVSAEKANKVIDCFVSDSGPGVPKDLVNKLFHFGTSSKVGHNGWGLYLLSRSMQHNGGDVQLVRSDATGTEFRLRFPAA